MPYEQLLRHITPEKISRVANAVRGAADNFAAPTKAVEAVRSTNKIKAAGVVGGGALATGAAATAGSQLVPRRKTVIKGASMRTEGKIAGVSKGFNPENGRHIAAAYIGGTAAVAGVSEVGGRKIGRNRYNDGRNVSDGFFQGPAVSRGYFGAERKANGNLYGRNSPGSNYATGVKKDWSARTPSGQFVSHVNDLAVYTVRPRHTGPSGKLLRVSKNDRGFRAAFKVGAKSAKEDRETMKQMLREAKEYGYPVSRKERAGAYLGVYARPLAAGAAVGATGGAGAGYAAARSRNQKVEKSVDWIGKENDGLKLMDVRVEIPTANRVGHKLPMSMEDVEKGLTTAGERIGQRLMFGPSKVSGMKLETKAGNKLRATGQTGVERLGQRALLGSPEKSGMLMQTKRGTARRAMYGGGS